jgi:hypothetical protein
MAQPFFKGDQTKQDFVMVATSFAVVDEQLLNLLGAQVFIH